MQEAWDSTKNKASNAADSVKQTCADGKAEVEAKADRAAENVKQTCADGKAEAEARADSVSDKAAEKTKQSAEYVKIMLRQ